MADHQAAPRSFPVSSVNDATLHDDSKIGDVYIDRMPSAGFPGDDPSTTASPLRQRETPFKFITTWRFWVILILGQILSWCIVSTNTLTQYLSLAGANIPAFQSLFNYALLGIIYTSWTLYKYGFKKWARLVLKDGWKYFVLAFADVQGVWTLVRLG